MKKGFKRLLSLGLAAVMTLPLAACGDGENAGPGAAVQKEFVYVPEYTKLEDESWLDTICGDGKGFYYPTSSFDETTGISMQQVKYFDAQTKEITEVALDFQTTDGAEEIADSGNIQKIALLDDGAAMVVLESRYEVINEETWEGINHLNLRFFNLADGTQTAQADITDVLEGSYAQYMTADKDGNLYISNGDSKIWVFDNTGKKLFDIAISNWLQGMGTTKEGQVVYLSYGQEGKVELNVIDPVTRSVAKTCRENVPDSWGNGILCAGWEKGVILSGNSGLVLYDVETETAEPILDWLDSDVNGSNVRAYTTLEDGRVLAVSQDFSQDESRCEIILLTKTPYADLPQKETLTLATLYTDPNLSSAVIRFNKASTTHRIQVISYRDGHEDEEWEDMMIRFNNDLTSGRGADLFDVSSLNVKMLAQKGVIEDLGPYLDNDPNLKREDFFESVLNAFTVNGKLYCIPNSVYIETMIGRTSEVGNKPGWTLDDVMAIMESRPEGTEFMDYASKDRMLQTCLMFSLDNYVNWETGECNLNSEDFIKVLEFANTFPAEADYDPEGESMPSKIQSGKMLVSSTNFSSVQDYQMHSAMFGGPITAIGYPTPEGTGSAFSGQNMLAMNAKSKNKEAAWAFISSFLTEEYYEEGNIWGIPTRISAYDKKNEEYMQAEYYEDENGEQVEVSKGGWGWDDFYIDLYAATQEEVDFMTNLINTCDRSYSYDTQLFMIVSEEAAPFFEGQKTAQEAADIMQSRVKMYVNENR